MKFNKKHQKGFTLIELLAVIAIIAILAAIGITSYTKAQAGARDSRRRSDMESVKQALVLYKQENDDYPTGDYDDAMDDVCGDYLSKPCPSAVDSTNYPYTYSQTLSGQGFCLCAKLERDDKGNSNDSCNFDAVATAKDYYCAVNP